MDAPNQAQPDPETTDEDTDDELKTKRVPIVIDEHIVDVAVYLGVKAPDFLAAAVDRGYLEVAEEVASILNKAWPMPRGDE